MSTEKTVTRETTTERQVPVRETKTTTTQTTTKVEPKPRVIKETIVVEED
jgi:hypothetical protein